jgi:hypothetical protein
MRQGEMDMLTLGGLSQGINLDLLDHLESFG